MRRTACRYMSLWQRRRMTVRPCQPSGVRAPSRWDGIAAYVSLAMMKSTSQYDSAATTTPQLMVLITTTIIQQIKKKNTTIITMQMQFLRKSPKKTEKGPFVAADWLPNDQYDPVHAGSTYTWSSVNVVLG